jgi:hypothetical protein
MPTRAERIRKLREFIVYCEAELENIKLLIIRANTLIRNEPPHAAGDLKALRKWSSARRRAEANVKHYHDWYRKQFGFMREAEIELAPLLTIEASMSPPKQSKKQGRLEDSYLNACKKNDTSKPTLEQWSQVSGEAMSKLSGVLKDPAFLLSTRRAAVTKINQQRKDETRHFWTKVLLCIEDQMEKRSRDKFESRQPMTKVDLDNFEDGDSD